MEEREEKEMANASFTDKGASMDWSTDENL